MAVGVYAVRFKAVRRVDNPFTSLFTRPFTTIAMFSADDALNS